MSYNHRDGSFGGTLWANLACLPGNIQVARTVLKSLESSTIASICAAVAVVVVVLCVSPCSVLSFKPSNLCGGKKKRKKAFLDMGTARGACSFHALNLL